MENGLVTGDGTKVFTVEEYNKFVQAIPESKRCIEYEILTRKGVFTNGKTVLEGI